MKSSMLKFLWIAKNKKMEFSKWKPILAKERKKKNRELLVWI